MSHNQIAIEESDASEVSYHTENSAVSIESEQPVLGLESVSMAKIRELGIKQDKEIC